MAVSSGPHGHNTWVHPTTAFALQLLTGRWFMMFASFMIMSVSGASYMFALYSRDIKSALGYDQSTLNLLSFFKDLGSNLGVLYGLLYHVTPPAVVLSLGAALNFLGYFALWLFITGHLPRPSVALIAAVIFVGANSHCSTNTAAVVTSVHNFPGARGIVIGMLSAYTGLSAAVIPQLYYAFYDDSKSLVLLMAWLPSVTALAFLPVIRRHKGVQQKKDKKVFFRFLYLSLLLAGFLLVVIVLEQCFKFSKSEYYVTSSLVLFLLVLPLGVVIIEELKIWKEKKKQQELQRIIITTENPKIELKPEPMLMPEEEEKEEKNVSRNMMRNLENSKPKTEEKEGEKVWRNKNSENPEPKVEPEPKPKPKPEEEEGERGVSNSWWRNILKHPKRGDDYTILQAIFSLDMLILFISTICGLGGTLTVVNNLSQIGTSLGYPPHSITTFVSLMAIWKYLGKIAQGVVSEFMITKLNVPRPFIMTAMLVLSCVGHLLVAFNVPNGLYIASIIIGFCFGATWPILFSIISELFGLKYYSTLYNVGSVASPLGSYLLSVRVAGYLYDKEAMRQMEELGLKRKEGEELNCNGSECYRLAFFIITGVTLFGALVSLVLVVRTRSFYRSDIYKKFREEEGEDADGTERTT